MSNSDSEEGSFLGFNESSVNDTMKAKPPPQQPMSSKMADMIDQQAQLARKNNEREQLAGKKAQRDAILRCIERIENFANRANGITQEQATTRINRLEKCWMEFEMITNELRLMDDACLSDENEQLYDETDESCMQIADIIKMKIIKPPPAETPPARVKETTSETHDSVGESSCLVKLPNLSLPVFTGKYDEWLPFRDMFEANIHNNSSLAPVHKIAYLKQSLKGEAASLINSFPSTGASYTLAWNALVERFSNEYILKKRYVNSLLQYPSLKSFGQKEIHSLVDTFERNIKLLKQLGEDTDAWGMLIIQVMLSKLDERTHHDWEKHVESSKNHSLDDLVKFLHVQSRVLDAVPTGKSRKTAERQLAMNITSQVLACIKCGEQHLLHTCIAFNNMAIDDKFQFVSEKRLCRNCLRPGHVSMTCKMRFRCSKCHKKHHTLLHREPLNEIPPEQMNELITNDSHIASPSINAATIPALNHVFLSTAMILIKNPSGKWRQARALLDNGAQVNIMSEALCRMLQLNGKGRSQELVGVGKCTVLTAKTVEAEIASKNITYRRRMNFSVLPTITGYHPERIDASLLNSDFQLADPDAGNGTQIDILLGSEYYHEFLQTRPNGAVKIRNPVGRMPAFIDSVFGWLATGKVKETSGNNLSTAQTIMHVGVKPSLEELIANFWEIEQIPEAVKWTPEEQECDEKFEQQHDRDSTGRYIVKLPFKNAEDAKHLGDSKSFAMGRFQQLERRFYRNPALKDQYAAVINEYISRGYLQKINESNTVAVQCFLPHHPVIKESSTSTKVRPVFDGSAKTSNGKSLNDVLMKGPVIQETLLNLLLRFRLHPIAITADIEKMYLQIKVHPENTPLQRILWRSDTSHPVETYELQRVTFGLSPSSFLATRVLRQLALDEGDNFPIAKEALLKDFYVDDYIGGADSEEKAVQLYEQLVKLLTKGGFRLQKWSTNSEMLLEKIDPADRASKTAVNFVSDDPVKTLGVVWLPASDNLYVQANTSEYAEPLTKRKVYSMIARLFDPIGLVAPIISWAKIRMQKLWIACHDWDDALSSELAEEWKVFHASLPLLSDIKIARYVGLPQSKSIQFHCFADASEAAYGAVLYLRSADGNGNAKVEILAAKSRPAPLKRISLARLELCAAVVAINLWNHVSKSMCMQNIETFMWSDSTVVLHWLESPSYIWATYVANRVSLIQDTGKACKWMHVRGTANPADLVSRGALPHQLLSSDLWFHGPNWLSSPQEDWKESECSEVPPEEILERKKQTIATVSVDTVNYLKRFSCYWKVLRFAAYCLRWKNYRRQKNPSRNALITVEELENAKRMLVRLLQNVYFPNEIRELSSGKPVRANSRLKCLHPFIDTDGLLRVGGRLKQTGIAYSGKHPLLLPGSSHFARLIVEAYHRRMLHAGPRVTLAEMRKEYWVIDGRRIANSVCKSCVKCFRADPKPASQPIGQLPESRATPARPFSVVGVDYCGPLYLKPAHRKAAAPKAYVAVFVCFVVKAVHLELVEDLSTAAFLAAFRRFVSRRGLPAKVYSDNGLNFRGASSELMELYRLLNDPHHQEAVWAECAMNKVEWHFIPPRAPNFGGLWEAAVKSAKRTLRKLFRLQRLSFGEMATVLVQIEAQMNSRPLTPLSEDPRELDVLTPGHFLIGTTLMALPDSDLVDVPENRVRKFQLLQQLVQRHWKRWRTEYLCELHNNNQRVPSSRRVAVGQMVILKEDNVTPCEWPLARIHEVHPGADGIVRVVTLRTEQGFFRRPVSRICLLPFEREEED